MNWPCCSSWNDEFLLYYFISFLQYFGPLVHTPNLRHAYTNPRICAYTHTHILSHIQTHAHTHPHTPIHTYIYSIHEMCVEFQFMPFAKSLVYLFEETVAMVIRKAIVTKTCLSLLFSNTISGTVCFKNQVWDWMSWGCIIDLQPNYGIEKPELKQIKLCW